MRAQNLTEMPFLLYQQKRQGLIGSKEVKTSILSLGLMQQSCHQIL